MIHDNSLIRSINGKRLSASLEYPQTIESCQVTLLILFRDDPRFDSIKDHFVDSNTISQVNGFLKTKDTQDFELNGREIVQKII